MSTLQFIALDQIKTEAQFRTRNGFDDNSFDELCTSIGVNGLLQPITVRKDEDSFVVVTGHRRFAAVQRLKWQDVQCLVTECSVPYILSRNQLIENLQRVDLDLLDTANAVRALAERAGMQGSGLSQLATDIGKSKTWVSRHLSLTDEKFSVRARELLCDGTITDLEVAHAFHQIEKAKGPHRAEALRLFELEVSYGRMTRKLALDFLAMAKEKPETVKVDDLGEGDGEGGADDQDDVEVTTTPMKAPAIKLTPEQYALFEEKGGMRWLLDLLTA